MFLEGKYSSVNMLSQQFSITLPEASSKTLGKGPPPDGYISQSRIFSALQLANSNSESSTSVLTSRLVFSLEYFIIN